MLKAKSFGNVWNNHTVKKFHFNSSFKLNFSTTTKIYNENQQHSYSDTVFLPSTNFGNRSNQDLIDSKLKPQTMSKLYDWNISRKIDSLDDLFILHDGPPYANGNLHIGHSLNKILKDIINRFQLISGKKVHYVPGWDCHGLPIELKTLEKLSKERKDLEKSLKKNLKKAIKENNNELKLDIENQINSIKNSKLSSTDIVKLATEHALNAQKIQSSEFQEMGIMGDFNNPYMTLKKDYIIDQLRIFKKFFDKGLVHRQEKPVYWGCENATALAEGELEYNQNHQSKSAYVKFPIVEVSSNLKSKIGNNYNNLSALIWTSTPWTLASNLAISVNDSMDYTIIQTENFGNLIIAVDLVDNLSNFLNFQATNIIFKGSDLIGCKYKSDILDDNQLFPFLHGNHVTSTAGTGLVHTAPGHGQDDYLVCLKNGIKPFSPVDKYGKYTNLIGKNLQDFIGLKVLTEGNSKMIEKISDLGILIHSEMYTHSYPYDWRSKKPIIIRATPQWFIDVSKIKDETIKALETRVKFHPERGFNRLSSFIRTRNEWCISRQRSWGVPIPVLYHRITGEALLDDKVIEKIIEVISTENIDGWFKQIEESDKDIGKWLPEDYQHLKNDYKLGTDTMDVWFDSGSSWKTIEKYLHNEGLLDDANKRGYLADIYLEGSDQHRGWFQSSVLTKVGTNDTDSKLVMPYANIVTHGFTLDEKGEKMSKSIGNTISPIDILYGNKQKQIPKIGIDGLRLWVAQSDYTNDINVGSTILKHVGDNIKKIRFTFKFLLGNLQDFDKDKFEIKYDDLSNLEKYILNKLNKLNEQCLKDYQEFNYFKIVKNLNHFINVDLSSLYFDVRKDSLYTDKLDCFKRASTLLVFEEILKTLVSILSPIMPIITQEVWNNMSKTLTNNLESPFHKGWYLNNELIKFNSKVEDDMKQLLLLKDSVNSQVSKLRNDKKIGSSLETYVVMKKGEITEKYNNEELVDLFVVSEVIVKDDCVDDIEVKVMENGVKCPRCWKKHEKIEKSRDDLCERCLDVVEL